MKWFRLLAALVVLVPAIAAQAADWPDKPVRMVVPFGAGATADIMARIVADKLAAAIGQPVVVENRTGAGGNVGAALVARSDPDGYTLLLSGSPTHSVGPHLFKKLNYEPMKDVPPVAMIAAGTNLLVVKPSLPVKSVKDLVALARSKSEQLTYSSAGIGTSGHLAAELLQKASGVVMRHVPFRSGAEAVTAVMSGEVDFMFFTLPALMQQVEAGKLRAIAVTSLTRSRLLPNIPTVAEEGYPGFEALAWYAVFAPRGTPAAITARVGGEIKKILAMPDIEEKMLKLGVEPDYMNAEELTRYIEADSKKWGELIKQAGIAAN
ncbi:tripartite tricarboxylate transporter substrate binding protein [Pseudolabrys taiwanensis]|uniref:Tripartite tricarboxylate transporter substrate binding protein n=1 Tax=Pseudolabrys taiwanensis TaxID=331696 RepID=A0A345ZUX1_9HYPH|nr:tripartite tricarboxylate transporter substrate binding protein [Pseudolabrys taiwanensis]AXK80718.1 tripartite tricarboxylate transporter substrate binding protein [Pseudolabrys taiwanensis]